MTLGFLIKGFFMLWLGQVSLHDLRHPYQGRPFRDLDPTPVPALREKNRVVPKLHCRHLVLLDREL